ncbi:MAG TPA: hypothetical protein VJY35_06645, partial [Candidatus Eisenbacteria bacterium]|nr:hypothetical protein [Candidatus Eisenbacteria bacterium]
LPPRAGAPVIPFPFTHDPEEPLHEDVGFLTDVHEAYDSTEQRVKLRAIPRRGLEFGTFLGSAREAQHAGALLYGYREQSMGIPLWMYGERLPSAVSGGATVLPVSSAGVPWGLGDSVFIWRDPFTWEIADFVSTAGGVTCSSLGSGWPAGTVVTPMRLGRLGTDAPVGWLNREIGTARLRFELDATGLAAPAGTPVGSLYEGVEVLDVVDPNRTGTIEENVARKLAILDQQTGLVQIDTQAPTPTPRRKLIWTATTRAEAAVMGGFIEARRGRAVPFWLPSFQSDMTLAADLAFGETVVGIQWAGYHEYLWPQGFGRRHVALYSPGFPLEFKAIVASAHSGGSPTETITFDAPTAREYPAATSAIMFLKYARLDSDEVRRSWLSGHVCEAELPIRELPIEEPVPA